MPSRPLYARSGAIGGSLQHYRNSVGNGRVSEQVQGNHRSRTMHARKFYSGSKLFSRGRRRMIVCIEILDVASMPYG
jgi:hypothetical protein